MNNLVGNQLGKYQLIRLLGHGGMAEVYEAFQPGTERSVAIKVLRGYGSEPPESIARFKREARSIAQLRHTNIVQVFDFDADQNRYYMVMEYIRGGTLNSYLRDRGALPAQEALRITIQLADALAYAHQHGVIHRDIKPPNIMFADLERQHPVLTDFGIARILNETAVTADGRFMGSPAYLSPEVALGKPADARSDIYGLGLTLYEMLTGRLPFAADGSTGMMAQHMIAPPPSPRQFNPDVHPALEMVVDKALAKSRDHRYQTANEFKLVLQQLEKILNGTPVAVAQPPPHPAPARAGVGTTIVLPGVAANGDSSTLPFDSPDDSRTRTLPFDESALRTEPEEKPHRRKPVFVLLLLLLLGGLAAYLALSGNQMITGDNVTPTSVQSILVDDAASETPTLTETATSTPTLTATPTLTLTPTITLTPTPSPTVDIPPVRENPFFRPTAFPSDTPTVTPTVRPTNQPRATQASNSTLPPQPVESAPTAVPPGDSGSGGGGTDGGNDPVGEVVDTVDDITQPVEDVLDEILPPLPTICLLGCG